MAKKKVVQEEIVLDKVVENIPQEQEVVTELIANVEEVLETVSLDEQGFGTIVPNDDVICLKLVLLDSIQTPQHGFIENLKYMVGQGSDKQEILDELVGFQTISQETLEQFISLL